MFLQAEGYRYLSRIVRAGLENFIECSDPYAPKLTSIVDGLRTSPIKLGSDNPDNLYQHATIRGDLEYRITGNVGTVQYLGFGTQAGQYGKAGGLSKLSIALHARLVDFKESFSLGHSCVITNPKLAAASRYCGLSGE